MCRMCGKYFSDSSINLVSSLAFQWYTAWLFSTCNSFVNMGPPFFYPIIVKLFSPSVRDLCLSLRHRPSWWFSWTTHIHDTTKALLQNIFSTCNSFSWDLRFSSPIIMTTFLVSHCFAWNLRTCFPAKSWSEWVTRHLTRYWCEHA